MGSPAVVFALAEAHRARSAYRIEQPSHGGFRSTTAKELAFAANAAAILAQLIPQSARDMLIGNLSNFDFLTEAEKQPMLEQAMLAKAGTSGATLIKVARTLVFINAFLSALGREPDSMWPMPCGCTAFLIKSEHVRATAGGSGSRGGATVGDGFRKTLTFMRDNLGFPIDLDGPLIAGAAPSAKASGGRRSLAATCSPRFYFLLETVASDPNASLVRRFFAWSLLLAALNGIRVQDAVRLSFFWDEINADAFVRGRVSMTKDGEPMDLFAPAEGIMGPLTWWESTSGRSRLRAVASLSLGGKEFGATKVT